MNPLELSKPERKNLWGRLAIRLLGLALMVVSSIYLLPPIIKMLFPFIAGVILARLMHPVIEFIRRKIKISRKILSFMFTVLFIAVVGGIVALLFYSVISQGISLVTNWLASGGSISTLLSSGGSLSALIETLPAEIRGMLLGVVEWLEGGMSSVLSALTAGVGGFIAKVPSFFIGIFVFISATYFISVDFPAIRASFAHRLKGGLKNLVGIVRNASATAFGAYLKSQLFLSLGVFCILWIGFLSIGQNYALLLALIFAVLDFIPIIGSGTVMIPWAVIALALGNSPMAIKLMVIWGVIGLFRRFLEPKVVGSQTGLSPFLALLSIFVGMRFAGVLGMILGPIILQIIFVVVRAGIFEDFSRDVKLFVSDVSAFMKKVPGIGGDSSEDTLREVKGE